MNWLRSLTERVSVIDVHVYGGIVLLACGVALYHIGLGLAIAGASLVYIGLRGT